MCTIYKHKSNEAKTKVGGSNWVNSERIKKYDAKFGVSRKYLDHFKCYHIGDNCITDEYNLILACFPPGVDYFSGSGVWISRGGRKKTGC